MLCPSQRQLTNQQKTHKHRVPRQQLLLSFELVMYADMASRWPICYVHTCIALLLHDKTSRKVKLQYKISRSILVIITSVASFFTYMLQGCIFVGPSTHWCKQLQILQSTKKGKRGGKISTRPPKYAARQPGNNKTKQI